MSWQPIETAPKNGTWVLLRGDKSKYAPPIVCAKWYYQRWVYGGFVFSMSLYRSNYDPTHWMPVDAVLGDDA